MNNIILIGMPASGKSTIGVVLAKTINMSFIDTDILIQEHEGKLLQELINEKGNDYFKKVEEHVLKTISTENTVISTGGSAIYYAEVMSHFKKDGKIVYIRAKVATIEERLDNIKTRGVTLEPGQTIKNLYDERVPLYEKYADITVDCDNGTVEDVIEAILRSYQR